MLTLTHESPNANLGALTLAKRRHYFSVSRLTPIRALCEAQLAPELGEPKYCTAPHRHQGPLFNGLEPRGRRGSCKDIRT